MAETQTDKGVRLAVNVNALTAAQLRYWAAQQDVSVTLLVAKAVMAYDTVMKAQEAGKKVEFVDRHTRQEVTFS